LETEGRRGGVCGFRYARDIRNPRIKELAQAGGEMVPPLVLPPARLPQVLDDSSVSSALPGIQDEFAVTAIRSAEYRVIRKLGARVRFSSPAPHESPGPKARGFVVVRISRSSP